jgi:hypothetical protein
VIFYRCWYVCNIDYEGGGREREILTEYFLLSIGFDPTGLQPVNPNYKWTRVSYKETSAN